MRCKLVFFTLLLWAGVGFVFTAHGQQGHPIQMEAQLLWGTTNSVSPDPKHKPVEAAVERKIRELPLKWSNYFTVNKKMFTVPATGAKKESLSERCDVEVKYVGKSIFEISLFGKGAQIVKRTQSLPKGEVLVLGGNAPNSTCWLVVVKRVE
jgi:hypothetical protein